MKIFSLFAGQEAFKNLKIEFNGINNAYYANKIDKYAIKITQSNHPATAELGDIKGITAKKLINSIL